MSYWVVSTTTGWNVGDDIIRQGVFNLTGIDPDRDAVVYYDRCVIGDSYPPRFIANEKRNAVPDMIRDANGLILAGTPEWANFQENLWRQAGIWRKPIHVVGVGFHQEPPLIDYKSLIQTCTVRDNLAKDYLKKNGYEAKLFLDPAFHADYPVADAELDIVFNYRPNGGNGSFGTLNDLTWKALYERFQDRIDLITVHELGEYRMARHIFPDAEVFYSSEPKGFQQVYANAKHYIGGRIHGAVQVAATGGTSSLLYGNPKAKQFDDTKVDCMNQARRILGGENAPIRTYSYAEADKIETFEVDTEKVVTRMKEDFLSHKKEVML